MIVSKYTNRKTVISRPTVSDKIDNLGKSGNKDSIKLVSTKDVEDILNDAKSNLSVLKQKILCSITDILLESNEVGAKTQLRTELSNLDIHQAFALQKAIIKKILNVK